MTLDGLQQAVRDRIKNDTWITPVSGKAVTVVDSIRGDIESQLNQSLGKLGACVVIDPPQGPVAYSNGTVTLEGIVEIWVFENVLMNRGAAGTQKTAAEICAKIIHLFKPGANQPVTVVRFDPQETVAKLLVYRAEAQIGRRSLDEPVTPEEEP